MANGTFEATFMVNLAFGKNLVSMVNEATTFGTSLAFGSLEAFALLQDVITIRHGFSALSLSSRIHGQGTCTNAKSDSFGTKSSSIAGFAVKFSVVFRAIC